MDHAQPLIEPAPTTSVTVETDDGIDVSLIRWCLAGLIEVKERIGREKDHAVLPLYRRTLAERDRAPAEG